MIREYLKKIRAILSQHDEYYDYLLIGLALVAGAYVGLGLKYLAIVVILVWLILRPIPLKILAYTMIVSIFATAVFSLFGQISTAELFAMLSLAALVLSIIMEYLLRPNKAK